MPPQIQLINIPILSIVDYPFIIKHSLFKKHVNVFENIFFYIISS